MNAGSSRLERLDRWVTWIETGLLAVLLFGMLGLACTQILLRNAFDSGITWADPLIRAMVLWVGLLGAVSAARRDKHIRVDVLTRFLSERWQAVSSAIGSLFTAGVAGFIAWHGARMVSMEREFETIAFSGIPAWTLQLVVPAGFGLIALIYAAILVIEARAALQGRRPS